MSGDDIFTDNLHKLETPVAPLGGKTIAQLVPTKSDQEYANELKQKLVATITPVLELVTLANKDGFEVQFGIGKDALGKQVITALKVMREY